MHKLIEFICDELEELERKADKDGKLSSAEIQYGDTLAHFKKNLLTAEAMHDEGYSGEYSYDRSSRNRGANQYGRYDHMQSGARYARRNRMGQYSRDGYSMGAEDMISELHELMHNAPDDHTKQEFRKFIDKIERM